ncbi:MAG: DsbA family protein [Chloroflexi bacterium]|nr:MAG: DsbA family protein [Chloroflexota bacterium]
MSPEKISKRQERREELQRQQQRQQRLTVTGLIGLGAALLVFAIVWPQIRSFSETPVAAVTPAVDEIATIVPVALPNAEGLSLGDPNAPVIIDVFEDFQCPACKFFTESIETLVIEDLVATGKARYVFHNYPFLDGEGAGEGGESDQAANASMCANEQGKFWEMHHAIYANWNGEHQGAFSDTRLQAMAESIGLDMNTFNECFSTNKYEADIQADLDLGEEMGVSGTPTVFVNGDRVGQPGKIATYEEIVQAVEQALNK